MKTRIALLAAAFAFALTAAAPSAHADKMDRAKKLVDRMMVHVAHFAKILDHNVKTPMKAMTQIQKYFTSKKNGKDFKDIGAKMKALKPFDKAQKKTLGMYVMSRKEVSLLMMSAMKFGKANPTLGKELQKVFKPLQKVFPK